MSFVHSSVYLTRILGAGKQQGLEKHDFVVKLIREVSQTRSKTCNIVNKVSPEYNHPLRNCVLLLTCYHF